MLGDVVAAAGPGDRLPDRPPADTRTIETEFRATTDSDVANRLLATLQKQAALDLIMLPISQSDEYFYVRRSVEMSGGSFGPGWQLGFFGISNA